MKNKSAILIGATGLVGSHILQELQNNPEIEKIRVFGRRSVSLALKNDMRKVEEHLIDFDQISDYADIIQGDVLFSCLGTTLKIAGSKEKQYKIDVTYQNEFARIAAVNKVQAYYLVSSPGADTKSMFFYSRIKGELEELVQEYNFEIIRIFRPSILTGNREQNRSGEKWAAWFMNHVGRYLPFIHKYKPISGATVAKAMVDEYLSNPSDPLHIYELDEIYDLLH